MEVIKHHINRITGNLCFATNTNGNVYLCECDRKNKHFIPTLIDSEVGDITDIKSVDSENYYVAFNNQYVGKFNRFDLNETFIDTGQTNISKIEIDKDGNLFVLDVSEKKIAKYNTNTNSIDWTFDIVNASNSSSIFYRSSDRVIFFGNNDKILAIQDATDSGYKLGEVEITGDEDLHFVLSSEFVSSKMYLRYRQEIGEFLDQSSSSSTSSSSSSSTSSSSSDSSSSTEFMSSSSTSSMSSSSSTSSAEV